MVRQAAERFYIPEIGVRLDQSLGVYQELAKTINQVDNRVSITGHTDARPYVNPRYTNWELSGDRANAARRH